MDNVFVERLLSTVKYENLYIQDYDSVPKLQRGLMRYFGVYSEERLHQSLEYRSPGAVYRGISVTTA